MGKRVGRKSRMIYHKERETMNSNIRQFVLSFVVGVVALSGVASAARNAMVADLSQLARKVS